MLAYAVYKKVASKKNGQDSSKYGGPQNGEYQQPQPQQQQYQASLPTREVCHNCAGRGYREMPSDCPYQQQFSSWQERYPEMNPYAPKVDEMYI